MVHGLETMAKLNAEAANKPTVKSIAFVKDVDTDAGAIYVNGILDSFTTVLSAHDIAEAVGSESQLITFRHLEVEMPPHIDWPGTLQEIERLIEMEE